ncbi:hypothetical protein [Mangrovicoccus sp. HB161399]|uniref:hypothetical protein n=1 Tax=Mangrovicoccus sp. HB161399 TaxID=2720392 RepID=UPI0015554513|nr:hypothetical protein [Mangrovicoccus sp. HB161399]
MAPAPRLGSNELAAEMAELYGLALLRDMRFCDIEAEAGSPGPAGVSPAEVIAALNRLEHFAAEPGDLDGQAHRRLAVRLGMGGGPLSGASAFRGAACGARPGPYLSQFLLQGSAGQARSGRIAYGAQSIDQRCTGFPPGLDYMGDWHSWLDVQNGADPAGLQVLRADPLFPETPRDLAAHVRADRPFQAGLNAALILLSYGLPADPGLGAVAGCGAPGLLAALADVSCLALEAMQRQKSGHHRRARPEKIGGVLTLAANGRGGRLGAEEGAAEQMAAALGATGLPAAVAAMNARSLAQVANPLAGRGNPGWLAASWLLPQAFIEGSPMTPSYGSGHAAAAGACVTVIKACLSMFRAGGGWQDRTMAGIGMGGVFRAAAGGTLLEAVPDAPELTVTGELDKLAANVAMGGMMAGVSYHSDCFDGLRFGERVAVGMLRARLAARGGPASLRFRSFDGDLVRLVADRAETLAEINGSQDAFAGWWTRDQPG